MADFALEVVAALKSMQESGILSGWSCSDCVRDLAEIHFIRDRREVLRQLETRTLGIHVLVDREDGFQGGARITLSPDVPGWKNILDQLAQTAAGSRNKPWRFAPQGNNLSAQCHDPRIAASPAAFCEELGQKWIKASADAQRRFSQQRPGHFEAFAASAMHHHRSSEGLDNRYQSTAFYVEGTLTTPQEERFFSHTSPWANLVDLEKVIARASTELHEIPDALTPPTGQYPIVLCKQATAALLFAAAQSLQAEFVYRGWSQHKVGDRFGSEHLTLTANPALPSFAFSAVDEDGQAQKNFPLVEGGKIVALATPHRLHLLTGMPQTGGLVSVGVKNGLLSKQELIASAKKSVLEILEFSSFSPDAVTGEFSGEVRMGYLHQGTHKIPIRGGSVSGNLFEILPRMIFSRECCSVFEGSWPQVEMGYHGPCHAFINSLSYAGQ